MRDELIMWIVWIVLWSTGQTLFGQPLKESVLMGGITATIFVGIKYYLEEYR